MDPAALQTEQEGQGSHGLPSGMPALPGIYYVPVKFLDNFTVVVFTEHLRFPRTVNQASHSLLRKALSLFGEGNGDVRVADHGANRLAVKLAGNLGFRSGG